MINLLNFNLDKKYSIINNLTISETFILLYKFIIRKYIIK